MDLNALLAERNRQEDAAMKMMNDRNRFQNLLDEELNKKTNYNKDLIEERNNATQQQLSLGQTLRNEWADSQIDPLQREAIIAQRRSQLGGRVGTLSDLLGARGQYFSDILGKALGAYDSETDAASRAAQLAAQRYAEAKAEADRRSAAAAQASYLQSLLDAQGDGGVVTEDVVDPTADIEIYVPDRPEDKQPYVSKLKQDYDVLEKYGGYGKLGAKITAGLANLPDFWESLFTKRKFK